MAPEKSGSRKPAAANTADASLASRIAKIKPVPASVQLLDKQLCHGEPGVRDAGLQSITKLKPAAEPLTDLLARLIEHQNWYIRRSASAALSKCAELEEDAAEIAIQQVAGGRLAHEDPDVRTCAARALIAIIKASNGEQVPCTAGLGIKRRIFGKRLMAAKQAATLLGHTEEEDAGSMAVTGGESRTVTGGESRASEDEARPRVEMTSGIEEAMDEEEEEVDETPRSTLSADSMFTCAASGSVSKIFGQLAIEELARCLEHANPRVRKLGIGSLTQLGDLAKPFAEKFARALADPDVSVRNAALGSFKLLRAHATPGVYEVAKLLCHRKDKIRRDALLAVHMVKVHSGKTAVAAVASQLADIVKQEKLLSKEKSAKSYQQSSSKREKEDRLSIPLSKRALLHAMAEMGSLNAPHAPDVIPFLDDPDVEIRATAIRALVSGGPQVTTSSVLKSLKKRMESQNANIRRSATDVLCQLGPTNPAIATFIGKVLLEDSSELSVEVTRQRTQALQVIGASGKHSKRYLNDVVRQLENTDIEVRYAAAEALVNLQEHAKSAGLEVSRRLLHADPVVRRAAVQVIHGMGELYEEFMLKVENLLDSEEDPDVISAVQLALDAWRARSGQDPSQRGGTQRTQRAAGAVAANRARRNSVKGKKRDSFSQSPKSPGSPSSPSSPWSGGLPGGFKPRG